MKKLLTVAAIIFSCAAHAQKKSDTTALTSQNIVSEIGADTSLTRVIQDKFKNKSWIASYPMVAIKGRSSIIMIMIKNNGHLSMKASIDDVGFGCIDERSTAVLLATDGSTITLKNKYGFSCDDDMYFDPKRVGWEFLKTKIISAVRFESRTGTFDIDLDLSNAQRFNLAANTIYDQELTQ